MCAASNLNIDREYPINYSRPGLVVIFNNKHFKEKGYKTLFTDLFASRDWGSIMDINFLAKLWKELGINEDFDLEKYHT